MAKLNKIEDLADGLHSTAIHLLRQVRVQDAATGIAPARLSALSVLVFGGAMSLNDRARAEQVRPPPLSRIVDALESEGLARRTVYPPDRHDGVVVATNHRPAVLWQGRKRRLHFLAGRLSRLSVSDRRQIESAVQANQKAMAK